MKSKYALGVSDHWRRIIASPIEVHRVLDGLDLKVKAGELVTIVAPSGCGKTTLLNIVAGLD